MGEEQIIIKAGTVGIVLGSRSREDMEKLRFLVSLAGTYEYVQNGSLRLLCCDRRKDADDALADPKAKSRTELLGEFDGHYYLAADQAGALHLMKKHPGCFRVVDESELLKLLQKISSSQDAAAMRKYQKLQKHIDVGTEVKSF